MRKQKDRELYAGGSTNPDYTNNWCALFLSIVKDMSADESMIAMKVMPDMKIKNM